MAEGPLDRRARDVFRFGARPDPIRDERVDLPNQGFGVAERIAAGHDSR